MTNPDFPIEDLPRPEDRYVPPAQAEAQDRRVWREVGWVVLVGLALVLWAWDELRGILPSGQP